MTIRYIHSLPVSAIADNDNDSITVSTNNKNSFTIQNNLEFQSGTVTGNDGETYNFLNSNKRYGFADDIGRKGGSPAANGSSAFFITDKIGNAGAYICKVGYGTEINHRWLRGVVGFDAQFSSFANSSTGKTSEPWLGKVGMVYTSPLSGQEFIYCPTVTMKGPTGELSTTRPPVRIARKVPFKGGSWNDIHDLGLLFTGIIFEWGHTPGGAVQSELFLYIYNFKPILCESKSGPNPTSTPLNSIKDYELLPRLRSFDEINDIQFDTSNI